MLPTVTDRNDAKMSELDPALEPGLQSRSIFEYVAWGAFCPLGLGLRFPLRPIRISCGDAAAKYFMHESILRGLLLTILLADRREAASDDFRLVGGLGQTDQCCRDGRHQDIDAQSFLEKVL